MMRRKITIFIFTVMLLTVFTGLINSAPAQRYMHEPEFNEISMPSRDENGTLETSGAEPGENGTLETFGAEPGGNGSFETTGTEPGENGSLETTGTEPGENGSLETTGTEPGENGSLETTGTEPGENGTLETTGTEPGETEIPDISSADHWPENPGDTYLTDGITMPIPAATEFTALEGDIIVSASSVNTSFATYSKGDGKTPENLTINLTVTLTRSGIEGGYVALPYGFFPAPETHAYFTMAEPFFEFIDAGITADSIFNGVNTSGSDRLILEIKNGLDATQQTVAVRFKLNDAYLNKIPNGSPLWSVKPEAYVGETLVNAPGNALNIRSSSSFNASVSASYFTPPNNVYTDGSISIRYSHNVTNAAQCELDPEYEHIYYIEVPTGSALDSKLQSFYCDDAQDMENGYTRYIRKLTGSVLTGETMDRSFTPPADIPVDTEFYFRAGYDYKLLNGVPAAGFKDCIYIKTGILDWNLYLATHHTSGSANLPRVDITGKKTIDTEGTVGWNTYIHNYTSKNLGTSPAPGVRFVMFQASEDSSKVAFDRISLCVSRDASKPAWSAYKVLYNIKNSLDTSGASDRLDVFGDFYMPTEEVENKIVALKLPALADGEYIDEVVVIPMGTDGKSEGLWPGKNGLGIRYHPKMWTGQVWPDGTFISDNTAVPLGAKIFYDEPMAEGGFKSLEHRINSYNTYYVATNTTAATAVLYATNSTGLAPGDTVQCEIRGFNNSYHGISVWENPRVVVRVPAQLELSGLEDMDLTDNNGNTHKGAVSVEKLPSSNATYSYYEFQVTGYNAPLLAGDSTAAFTIPVKFRIAEGAAPGNYSINRVLVSNGKPETFRQIQSSANYMLNNLPAGESAADYGFSDGEFYSARTSSTNFNIRSVGLLTSKTSIRGLGTGGFWSDASVVPAQKGENVQMRVVIENKGNTVYSSIRLYDILPKEGDALGSTGSVNFMGVEGPADATVRYSTASPPTPTYGQHGNDEPNLQTYSFSSWTANRPPNPMAVYIDFGAAQISPGESVEVILKFFIPTEAREQKALNQFRYSGKEAVTNNVFNFNSSVSGFSTEAIGLAYNENTPGFTVGDVGGMPEALSGTFGIGSSSLTIAADKPTLTGYTFEGWYVNEEGTGNKYTPGGVVTFSSPGAVTLYAKWTPIKVRINFDKNGGDTEARPDYSEADFGAVLTAEDFPSIDPAWEGHSFGGWSTSSGENNSQDFTAGALITSAHTMTAYAVWKEQSEKPSINTIKEGDREVGGKGKPGAEITVIFPDGRTETATADENGDWTVTVPDETDLRAGDIVTANQIEIGKIPGDNVDTTVIPAEINKEQSESPSINEIVEGDREVGGKGKPGAEITVTFPDGRTKTTVADENGDWSVTAPDETDLYAGDIVTANQTENGKIPSDDVNTKVIPKNGDGTITAPDKIYQHADDNMTENHTENRTENVGIPGQGIDITINPENEAVIGTGNDPAAIMEMPEEIKAKLEIPGHMAELGILPDYPPNYQLIQIDDDTIELEDQSETLLGQWVNEEEGWIYYANPDTPQLEPEDDGSFNIISPDGTPVGLWSKNEDEEWTYEEYLPTNSINLIALCGLAALLAGIYFFIIARRHITREEFVRMVVRAIHLDIEYKDAIPYSDVSEDAIYYPAIMSAKAAGILSAFPESEFQPVIAITREEMAAVLAETIRYANIPMPAYNIDLSAAFKDFDKLNEFYLADLQLVVQLKIMRKRSDNRFDPKGLSTRRQAAKIIKKLLEAISPHLSSDSKN